VSTASLFSSRPPLRLPIFHGSLLLDEVGNEDPCPAAFAFYLLAIYIYLLLLLALNALRAAPGRFLFYS
jgi:hypothetical protein